MGEKNSVGHLGLVLEPDSVPGLMVSNCMLEDYDIQHLLGVNFGEFTIIEKGSDKGIEGMDAFVDHWHTSERRSSWKCKMCSSD